ncbi:MAG: tetratricopeptide repeat protein [Planctomycetaceae bacterium]|nr:tetratricopeptide repeat protein [Planctomycetaceae bacterium]
MQGSDSLASFESATRPRGSSTIARRRAWTLVAVHLAMVAHYVHWKLVGRTLAPLELNEAVYTAAEGVVTAGFVLLAVLVLASAVFGRFFCSWGCHVLALQDLCAHWLERVGIRPRPLRSRVLFAIPFLVAAYMFVWPLAYRAWLGLDVELHQRPAGTAWSSFLTDDFTRNLPSWPVALATLATCGFASVLWLGSRAFCSHACPYGALFSLADRAAPGRIVARGDCSDCGACTAACQSHIRVHLELTRFGTVVDPACLRDLDCVAACPDGRVRFGFVRPPLLKGLTVWHGLDRKWDASWGEEALLLAVVSVGVFSLRGLFDVLPLLLTVIVSVMLAFAVFQSTRFLRGKRLRALGRELRNERGVTGAGRVWVVASSVLLLAVCENAVVRAAELLAGSRLASAQATNERGGSARLASSALRLYRFVERLSVDPPADLRERVELASALTRAEAIEPQFPTPAEFASSLARIEQLAGIGRIADALELANALATRFSHSAIAHYQHGVLLAASGREAEALAAFERSVALAPDDVDAQNNLGFLLMRMGRAPEAEEPLRRAAELGPLHAAARFNRGAWLLLEGRASEALPHLRAASELDARYGPIVDDLLATPTPTTPRR